MTAAAGELTGLSVGHVTHDRYGDRILPGGCAFYAAKSWAALGGNARLATVVGEDFKCFDELENLELSVEASGLSTLFTNIYPEGRNRVQIIESEAPPIISRNLPDDWRKPDFAFIAPVFGELEPREWLNYIDTPLIGCGLQGLLKQRGGTGREVVARPFDPEPDLLTKLDAVFLSDEDVVEFASAALVERLRESVPLVVVTSGNEGCAVYFRGGVAKIGVFETEAKDPTGAGDTFAGAFLFGLAMGKPIIDAAKLASAAASFVVEGEGGTLLDNVSGAFERASGIPVISDHIGSATIK